MLEDFNWQEFKRLENDLTYYPGWIPPNLCVYLNMYHRVNFLKAEGLFERVEKQNIEYRNNVKSLPDNEARWDYRIRVLVDWCFANPDFIGLIDI